MIRRGLFAYHEADVRAGEIFWNQTGLGGVSGFGEPLAGV